MFCSSSFSPIINGSKKACRSARPAGFPENSNSGTGIARWCIPTACSMPKVLPKWRRSSRSILRPKGLFQRTLGKAVDGALAKIPRLAGVARPRKRSRSVRGPSFAEALRDVHHPETPHAIAPEAPARKRLGYDELLASPIGAGLDAFENQTRARPREHRGWHDPAKNRRRLPFALTASQKRRASPRSTPISARQRGCCGCCKAMSARARRLSRCSPWRRWSRRGGRRR